MFVNDNQHAPNCDDPNRDRLYKLRPFLDELFEKCQTVYTPDPSIAIDKSLLLWKADLSLDNFSL